MNKPVYLDYMATTPIDAAVITDMKNCLGEEGVFGNSSSVHSYGWQAQELVCQARDQVASLINAEPKEIIWTSGATESNNLAIKGVVGLYHRQGKHIITMSTEHKAVIDTCRFLESQGFEVTYLDPESDGVLDLGKLVAAIRTDTILISIMHVNNETGVIQDIRAIGEITRRNGVLFHVDAAQSVGKIPIDLKLMSVDLMAFCAHKIYGPKGVGALFVRRKPRVRLEPMIHGGGHEGGMRAGTLPTHQLVGMGSSFALAAEKMLADKQHILNLRREFLEGIVSLGATINGAQDQSIPGCLNLRFEGVDGESLLLALRNLAISSGSACNSASSNPSHVLLGMGLTRQEAYNSIRVSLGRFTSSEDVQFACRHIVEEVNRLRAMSPLWDKAADAALKSHKG